MTLICRSVVWAALVATLGYAQVAGAAPSSKQPVGMVEQPCPPTLEMPTAARDLLIALFLEPRRLTPADFAGLASNPEFKAFNEENRLRADRDWPGLCRYRAANASALSAPAPPRVVFMGDSITENWALGDPGFFDRGLINRGISGQTTAQMLVRFQSDVIALRPQIVHILGGTNDIAGNTGPMTAQDFENNIKSMVQIARANGIRVILGSIPPVAAFNWQPEVDPKPWVKKLNVWLRAYAAQCDVEYIDYYPLLAGPSGEFRADLSNDGVHPNRSGYRLMRELVQKRVLQSDH
jgi:lysophospholipase L1-like esterase